MKKLFLTFILLLFGFIDIFSQVIPIDSVRRQDPNGVPLLLNQIVTVRGVVTTNQEFGTYLVYFQDPTGGLVGYDAPFCAGVTRGDSIQVTGKVVQYNGLTELQPVNSFSILATGKTVVPKVVTTYQMRVNGENYEGQLIKINNITLVKNTNGVPVTQWTVTGSGVNYRIFDGVDSCDIRIYATSNIANTFIPPYPFSVTALCSQFKSSSPYIGGYQILPRDLNDIVTQAPGPVIANVPIESNITPTSITLTWTTLSAGDSKVKFFVSDSLFQPVVYKDSVYDATQTTNHVINITGLIPGRIYYAHISSTNGSGTSSFSPKYFATASHPSSTGKTEVYFNKSVDTSVAFPGNKANGNTDLRTRLMQRIDSAQYSIDFAIYSFNDLTQIRDKLLSAVARGVKLRVVYDSREGNIQALMQDLINAGVRVSIRPIEDTSRIMHNKFFIFDARDTAAHTRKWLWTGSANITNDQFYNDVQNVIFIQDETLCNIYTREFEEMWGSHNDVNNPSLAKFGTYKSDNTPHILNIKGKRYECYFSPSDDVSGKVENLILNQTHKSINFCIYSFTRFNIANRMKTKYNPPSVMVRGVFDQSNVSNTLYLEMKGIGGTTPWNPAAKVYLESYYNSLLHSKYIVIDADMPESNPVVETGSYNFSNSASFYNDENVLFIYDSLIANQYYQEFVKRLTDAGGSIGINKISSEVADEFRLSQNYPNPFNSITKFNISVPKEAHIKIQIYDVLGRKISELIDQRISPGIFSISYDANGLSSGVYFYSLIADGQNIKTNKMLLNK